MAKLTTDQVKKVAKLANLKLTDQEVEKFVSQLSETIDYIQKLEELDTKHIEPTNQVTGLINVTRGDQTAPSLSQDQALSNATAKEKGYFKVKAIFD